MPSESCRQRNNIPDDSSSVCNDVRKVSVNDTNVEDNKVICEDMTQLPKGFKPLATSTDIEFHESRGRDSQSIPGALISSDKKQLDTQVHNQVERVVDFHESGLVYESVCYKATVYTMTRIELPTSLIAVPVININDLTVGVELTIEIKEDGLDKDFLYLTMNNDAENKCWRLRWAATEKIETTHNGRACAKTPRFGRK